MRKKEWERKRKRKRKRKSEKEKETRPPKKRPSKSTNLHWFQISDCIFAVAKFFHFST